MDLSEIHRAIQASIKKGLEPLEAAPPMRLSEWAAEHFYLSAESSYVEQSWVAYPYQVAIMDCMSHDEITEVTVKKSARVGYTKMILAAIGYYAEHKRRNQAVWQPTDDDSDDFVKTEIDPMLRDVRIMQKVFPEYLSRHRNNTLRQKTFLSSILHLRGGKAAKNYRRITVDVALLDEVDGFDNDIEKEGSPINLSRKRTEGATFPKQILGSTPKLKYMSMIEAREQEAERRYRFNIPCVHCHTYQELKFGGRDTAYGFKWINNDPDTVAHVCQDCGGAMTQADYLAVWQQGKWLDQHGGSITAGCIFIDAQGQQIPVPQSVGFHVWTAYSPQTSWAQIVREFLSAKTKAKAGDKSELKTFVNTTLGETWEEEVEKTDQHELMARAEAYSLRHIPLGCLVLTCGVDVQDTWFEICVWGWGRGEEMWLVDHLKLQANPADERDWAKLEAYLSTRFQHASGQMLGIEATAIDTGGHFTHQVYDFCRMRSAKRIFAIKGDTKQGCPVKSRASMQDINWRGKIIKNGVKLWLVGTDTAKDLLHGRLKVTQAGPGRVHFSSELPADFYAQLTAEVRAPQKTSTGDQYRWVKRGSARNEVLDCTVYAMFAAHMLDLHRFTEKMWQKLADVVQPNNGDLFASVEVARQDQEQAPVPVSMLGNRISLKGSRRVGL